MKEISIDIKREIVQAVFLMRPDTFFLLIQKHGMPDSLLHDVECCSIPIPIYYLTKCWDHQLKDDWNEDVMEEVKLARENNNRIKTYFEKEWDIDFDKLVIPFYKLECTEMRKAEEDETMEDILYDQDISQLIQNCRAIDLELYVAVEKFQLDRVEQLLKEGGDPQAYLYDGDMKDVPSDPQDKEDFLFDHALQAWWRIEIHASGVGVDCQKIVISNESCDNWRNYTHLLDWTAHDMMQKLFLEYID